MTASLRTSPHRENPDWYRVKFRLASTLCNQAFVAKTSYGTAGKEVDDLLAATWTTIDLERWRAGRLRWLFWRRRDQNLLNILTGVIEPAALILKATVAAGIAPDPGRDEELDLDAVRVKLRAKEPVTPLTIIEAIVRGAEKTGPGLLSDLACFFQVSGDEEAARRYLEEAVDAVPPADQARYRTRIAADPMLKTIRLPPGPANKPGAPASPTKRLCGLFGGKAAPSPEKPKRPWG